MIILYDHPSYIGWSSSSYMIFRKEKKNILILHNPGAIGRYSVELLGDIGQIVISQISPFPSQVARAMNCCPKKWEKLPDAIDQLPLKPQLQCSTI